MINDCLPDIEHLPEYTSRFTFPSMRFPYSPGESIFDFEKAYSKEFDDKFIKLAALYGYPRNYLRVDYGLLGGLTFIKELPLLEFVSPENLLFRRNITSGNLIAKTLPAPLCPPNFTYCSSLDEPIKPPDLISQSQYFSRKFSRNLSHFDFVQYAKDFLPNPCEEQNITRSNCIAIINTVISKTKEDYLIHPTGPNLNILSVSIITLCSNANEYEKTCNVCSLTCSLECKNIINLDLNGRIRVIQCVHLDKKDYICCGTDFNMSIFEFISIDEFKLETRLTAKLPFTIISCDLSPYLPVESCVLLDNGEFYFVGLNETIVFKVPIPDVTEDPKGIIFGAYPRQFIIAYDKSIYILATCGSDEDRRTYTQIYSAQVESIQTIVRHPINHFLFIFATQSFITIMDIRQPDVPMLEACPEIASTIDVLYASCLNQTRVTDQIRILSLSRDHEIRLQSIRGGMRPVGANNALPVYYSEPVLKIDHFNLTAQILRPFAVSQCQMRISSELYGAVVIEVNCKDNNELQSQIIISMSKYGDLSWQQVFLSTTPEVTSVPVLITPNTHFIYSTKHLLNALLSHQIKSNQVIIGMYSDQLFNIFEFFHTKKLIDWFLLPLDKRNCYICYEKSLPFDNQHFPSYCKLRITSNSTNFANVNQNKRFKYLSTPINYSKVNFDTDTNHDCTKTVIDSIQPVLMTRLICVACHKPIDLLWYTENNNNFELPFKNLDTSTQTVSHIYESLYDNWFNDFDNKNIFSQNIHLVTQ